MLQETRICSECKHIRRRPVFDPFPAGAVLTPEIVKLKAEWQKQQTDIVLNEKPMYENDEPFSFEPTNYPWCARWTVKWEQDTSTPLVVPGAQFTFCAHGRTRMESVRFLSQRIDLI